MSIYSLPANRSANWTPGTTVGVIGGIPITRNTLINVTNAPYFASNTGGIDATLAIQSGLNDAITANNGSVVYLPAGLYVCSGGIINIQGKSNYTIRGQVDVNNNLLSTIAFTGNNSVGIYLGYSDDYLWNYPSINNVVTGSVAQGTTTLLITDTTPFIVGQLIKITTQNQTGNAALTSGAVPTLHVFGNANVRSQMSSVVSKTAYALNISPGLYYDSTSLQVNAFATFGTSTGVGVENLSIDLTSGQVAYGVQLEECVNSWFKNITAKNSNSYGFYLIDCLNTEMRYCFQNMLNHAGTNGAGLLFESNSACLIEDNILYSSFPNVEVNFGSCGNVFGYNFYYMCSSSGGFGFGIDTNHGAHNSFNLYEGSIATNLECDGFFGSSSEDVVYRNWFTSVSPFMTGPNNPLKLKRFTRNYTVVGNIFGTTGVAISTYEFGYPNIGNNGFSGYVQPTTGLFWQDWHITGRLLSAGGSGVDATAHATVSIGAVNGANLITDSGMAGGNSWLSIAWSGGFYSMTLDNNTNANWNYSNGVLTASGFQYGTAAYKVELPPVGTYVQIFAGAQGYQELDMDVQASTTLSGNYNTQISGVPTGESIGSTTLPPSLYYASQPSWWTAALYPGLVWPPFDPSNPNMSYTAIPASYRFFNGNPFQQFLTLKRLGAHLKMCGYST